MWSHLLHRHKLSTRKSTRPAFMKEQRDCRWPRLSRPTSRQGRGEPTLFAGKLQCRLSQRRNCSKRRWKGGANERKEDGPNRTCSRGGAFEGCGQVSQS